MPPRPAEKPDRRPIGGRGRSPGGGNALRPTRCARAVLVVADKRVLSSIFVAREFVLDGSPSNVIPTRIAMREQIFHRIRRLPPYVFGEVNAMKAQARAAGRDIIDLGMGNPDQPTPARDRREADRGGAQSAHPSLLDVARHSGAAPGAGALLRAPLRRGARSRDRDRGHARLQGGPRQPRPGDHGARRRHPGAQSELPDPSLRLHHRRRGDPPRAGGAGRRPAGRARARGQAFGAAADRAGAELPVQPHGPGGRSRFLQGGRGVRPPPRDLHPVRPRLRRDLFRRAAALDPAGPGRQGDRGRVHLDEQDLQHAGLADRLRRRQSGP